MTFNIEIYFQFLDLIFIFILSQVTPNEVSSLGGTEVVIEGTDLGVSADQVISVKLAGVECIKSTKSKQN